MARYIDAVKSAEIISEKLNIPLGDLVDIFAEIPTADVVEVVRCKDCKYGINHQNQKSTLCTLKEPYEVKWENAFCSNGERRE